MANVINCLGSLAKTKKVERIILSAAIKLRKKEGESNGKAGWVHLLQLLNQHMPDCLPASQHIPITWPRWRGYNDDGYFTINTLNPQSDSILN